MLSFKASHAMEQAMTAKPGTERQVGLAFEHLQHGGEALDQGDLAAALGHFRRSLAALRKLAAADPSVAVWPMQLAHCQMRIGTVLLRQGRTGPAEACLTESRAICLELLADDAAGKPHRWRAATHLEELGDAILEDAKDPDRALEHYQTALEVWRSLAAEEPAAGHDGAAAMTHMRIGTVLELRGDLQGALERFHEALSIRQKHAQTGPSRNEWQAAVAFTHARVGAVLQEQASFKAALGSHRSCVEILRTLTVAEPAGNDWHEALAYSLKSIGDILKATGTPHEALEHHEESVSILSSLVAAGRSDPALLACLAFTLEQITDARQGLDDLPGALRSVQESQRLWQQLAAEEPAALTWQEKLGTSHMNACALMAELQDLAGAFRTCQQAVLIRRRLVEEAPARLEWLHDLTMSQTRLEDLQSRLMSAAGSSAPVTPRSLH
jgi:tetratricopeptide (TPR) repeat protein